MVFSWTEHKVRSQEEDTSATSHSIIHVVCDSIHIVYDSDRFTIRLNFSVRLLSASTLMIHVDIGVEHYFASI